MWGGSLFVFKWLFLKGYRSQHIFNNSFAKVCRWYSSIRLVKTQSVDVRRICDVVGGVETTLFVNIKSCSCEMFPNFLSCKIKTNSQREASGPGSGSGPAVAVSAFARRHTVNTLHFNFSEGHIEGFWHFSLSCCQCLHAGWQFLLLLDDGVDIDPVVLTADRSEGGG